MPLPIAALLSLDAHLDLSQRAHAPFEQQRLIALTLINHLGSLGRVIAFLSTAKIRTGANFECADPDRLLTELDCGLFTLGEIQAALADSAYAAVEELTGLHDLPPQK